MAIRLPGRPMQVAASVLAVGTMIAAVGCEMGSHPTAPSSGSAMAGAGSGAGTEAGVPQAQAPRMEICHTTGNGHYQLITINSNAEQSHRSHGDGRTGEEVPGRAGYRFDSACYQEQIPPPSTPPPSPPPPTEPPPPATTLACPCWNNYTDQQLLSLLNAVPVVGSPLCASTLNGALLSPDNGITLVYASNSINACRLRLNGQDTNLLMPLTQEQADQCLAEAVSFIPRISWCAQ